MFVHFLLQYHLGSRYKRNKSNSMLNTQHAQHDGSTQPCPLGERIEGGGGRAVLRNSIEPH
jgi:hypothetical protein